MKDLDLATMRSAAERFLLVASDESSSVRDYIETYNAYIQAVGIEAVIRLLDLAESASAGSRAILSEAENLRRIHEIVEEKPLNSMTREDKRLAFGFLEVTGLPNDEYQDRRILEYAKWLEHRSLQIDPSV